MMRRWKKKLSPQQYEVTQKCGTEEPFNNEYWNNKREGIYVDIVSGEPLFSSLDKSIPAVGGPVLPNRWIPGILSRKKIGVFLLRVPK